MNQTFSANGTLEIQKKYPKNQDTFVKLKKMLAYRPNSPYGLKRQNRFMNLTVNLSL